MSVLIKTLGVEGDKSDPCASVLFEMKAPAHWIPQFNANAGIPRNPNVIAREIAGKKFSLKDFGLDEKDISLSNSSYWKNIIGTLNDLRNEYLDTGDSEYLKTIKDVLPVSYNLKVVLALNAGTLREMCENKRKETRTDENWKDFCKWVDSVLSEEG